MLDERGVETVKILFVADVVGSPGRRAVKEWVPKLRKEMGIDFVIANGENAAGGLGITPATARELFEGGVDCITTGNHVWRHKEIVPFLVRDSRLLRPANFPLGTPGVGWAVFRSQLSPERSIPIGVLNLCGVVFMEAIDCPFRTADRALEEMDGETKIVVVDFHAEATSEKQALTNYLDGRVTAVVGTHTHVATADEHLLPKGTAYITDCGMTGPIDSIIGMRKEIVLQKFLTKMPVQFEVAAGDAILSAVLVEADESNGRAVSISRIQRMTSTQPKGERG